MTKVVEMCSNCMREVEMSWNTEADGYKAFCPYCGERLMLCDECMHSGNGEFKDDCDYDSKTDTCKRNRSGRKMTIEKAIEVLKDLRTFDDGCEQDCEALDIAIKALKNLHLIKSNAYVVNKFLNEVERKNDD